MISRRFKINKLIRDYLPRIMRQSGVKVHKESSDASQFINRLNDKLLEEAEELKNATSTERITEELADILEVLQTLAKASGISMDLVEEVRLEKRGDLGGFDRKIYCQYMELKENNKALEYYLSQPEKYPEITTCRYKSDCIFCQIAKEKRKATIIEKFQYCYAIKDEFPVSNGHVIIIPYEHTENWFTATKETRSDMMMALHHIKEKLDLEYKPDGYNIGANCGEVAGQSVMHLHMHLIPRYKGDMDNPKGGVRGVIPDKQKY